MFPAVFTSVTSCFNLLPPTQLQCTWKTMPEHQQRILIVEDDTELRDLVVDYLARSGYQLEVAGDGASMRAVLNAQTIDLIVLDLMLPGEDGLTLLRWLSEQHGPPVIIVSARGDEVDRVVGLELGADDYLAKPFGPRELLARVRAVLRRTGGDVEPHDSHTLTFGPFRLHLNNHALSREGIDIPLTSGEFNLLRVLLEHPNQVLSRDHLISLLKGYERSPFDRSIDVRVTRLRRKIETRPESPVYLRTVWGEGYLFTPQGE
jgi:two-component system, OmpR family, phosphate regulon response regulator OmpR